MEFVISTVSCGSSSMVHMTTYVTRFCTCSSTIFLRAVGRMAGLLMTICVPSCHTMVCPEWWVLDQMMFLLLMMQMKSQHMRASFF